jgi:hypothetical protein
VPRWLRKWATAAEGTQAVLVGTLTLFRPVSKRWYDGFASSMGCAVLLLAAVVPCLHTSSTVYIRLQVTRTHGTMIVSDSCGCLWY